jgi:hypothetical protein
MMIVLLPVAVKISRSGLAGVEKKESPLYNGRISALSLFYEWRLFSFALSRREQMNTNKETTRTPTQKQHCPPTTTTILSYFSHKMRYCYIPMFCSSSTITLFFLPNLSFLCIEQRLLFRRWRLSHYVIMFLLSIGKSFTSTYAIKMDTDLLSPGLFCSHPGLWEQPSAADYTLARPNEQLRLSKPRLKELVIYKPNNPK